MAYYASPAAILVISILLPTLGLLSVPLRFSIRRLRKHEWWYDDWLIIPPVLLECAIAGLLIWGAVKGSLGKTLPGSSGKQLFTGTPSLATSASPQETRMLEIQYLVNLLSASQAGLLKISNLVLFRRIFCYYGRIANQFNRISKICGAFLVLWTATFTLALIFICGGHPVDIWSPPADIWASLAGLGYVRAHCPSWQPLLKAFVISDFVLTLALWTIPFSNISLLHANAWNKVKDSIGMLLAACIAVAISATRMAIYVKYVGAEFASLVDAEQSVSYMLFWTMMDCGLSVLAASISPVYSYIREIMEDKALLRSRVSSNNR